MSTQVGPVLPKLIGERVRRREDPRLIQGLATYVDDVKLPGMLYMALKRSDIAHGNIRSIDTSAAEAMEGVELVLTGAQLAESLGPMPIGTPFPAPDHHSVATDRVRYVGEPVAVVVAEDRYLARDAADAILVDYEELPAVVDPEAAMTGGTTLIHDEFERNIAVDGVYGGTGVNAETAQPEDDSEVDAAFAEADVVIRQRMLNQRLAPNAIEPRGVVGPLRAGPRLHHRVERNPEPAYPADPGGRDARHGRAPGPGDRPRSGRGIRLQDQHLRRGIHGRRGFQDDRRPGQVDRGPDRGVPGHDSRPRSARRHRDSGKVGRQDPGHSRQPAGRHRRLPGVADSDHPDPNRVDDERGLQDRRSPPRIDGGLHQQDLRPTPIAAPDVPRRSTSWSGSSTCWPVNWTWIRPSCGAWNFMPAEEFPYPTVTGLVYDSGNYVATLDKALEVADWQGMLAERERARAEGRIVGVGMSFYVEVCGLGPSSTVPVGGWEHSGVTIERGGKITATTGSSPHGQGNETTFAQMLADHFSVPIEEHHNPARGHRHRKAGNRDLWQPLAGGGRSRAEPCRRQDQRKDETVRGGPAFRSGGFGRGPRIRRRADPGNRSSRR